jgi:transcriptional regulator with XRE-family HTH domain
MLSINTPADGLRSLAEFARKSRLAANIPMEVLASRAGVNVNTLSRFERTGAGTTETMFRVFFALGVIDSILMSFAIPDPVSIAEARRLATLPQKLRARRKR